MPGERARTRASDNSKEDRIVEYRCDKRMRGEQGRVLYRLTVLRFFYFSLFSSALT
jgi:hypothetical protein